MLEQIARYTQYFADCPQSALPFCFTKQASKKNQMAKIDTRFTPNDRQSTEFHVGNQSGDPGVNPLGPVDAPNIPPNVVVSGNAGKQLNITTPFQKIVNPA
jgi:hypothetical protein